MNKGGQEGKEQLERRFGYQERAWVKVFRAVLWVLVVIMILVGWFLLSESQTSRAVADGVSDYLAGSGSGLLGVGVLLGVGNLCWGVTRWILRWQGEGWRPGRVIGKLIGGGIWRMAVFTPLVLISFLVLAPMVGRGVKGLAEDARENIMSGVALVEGDYLSGKIDVNEYITYSMQAAYNPQAAPERYWTDEKTFAPDMDILFAMEEHWDELDPETVDEILTTIGLGDVSYGGEEETASEKIWLDYLLKTEPATARVYNVNGTRINKAKLSNKGNFLVFYTDNGADAITDAQADMVAEMLEDIIVRYKNKFGWDFRYEPDAASRVNERDMLNFAEEQGISREQALAAMPVYMVNPYEVETNVLATYYSIDFVELLKGLSRLALGLGTAADGIGLVDLGENGGQGKFLLASGSFPLVRVDPRNLDDDGLLEVLMHEMGHHYTYQYKEDVGGVELNPQEHSFTIETVANWLSLQLLTEVPQNDTIAAHYARYVTLGTCYPIDITVPAPGLPDGCHDQGAWPGYAAVGMLETYADLVPDATDKIMTATVSESPLEYLRDAAGEELFAQVMTELAQRNLTRDYNNMSLQRVKATPPGETLPCDVWCTSEYEVQRAATKYIYLPAEQYAKAVVKVTPEVGESVSILKMRLDGFGENWTLLDKDMMQDLSIANGNWEVMEESMEPVQFTVEMGKDYAMMAIAVENYDIANAHKFTVEIEEQGLDGFVEVSEGCYELKMDAMFSSIEPMMGAMSFLDPLTDYAAEFEQAKNATSELDNFVVTVCGTQFKEDLDVEELVKSLKAKMTMAVDVPGMSQGDERMFVGWSSRNNEAKAYYLLGDGVGIYMLNVNVRER